MEPFFQIWSITHGHDPVFIQEKSHTTLKSWEGKESRGGLGGMANYTLKPSWNWWHFVSSIESY